MHKGLPIEQQPLGRAELAHVVVAGDVLRHVLEDGPVRVQRTAVARLCKRAQRRRAVAVPHCPDDDLRAALGGHCQRAYGWPCRGSDSLPARPASHSHGACPRWVLRASLALE